jgi:SAM-dependent methyltransferase
MPPTLPPPCSTAALCVHWARKLGVPLTAAFDVGCSVGRTTFDLSADFGTAVGLDFSHAFVAAANRLKDGGALAYRMTEEGEVTSEHVAKLPAGARPARCAFLQGDACDLPPNATMAGLGVPDGGRFSVIHGANLLCRLPEPKAFLRRLPSLLVPGGLVVFVSPYSWLKQYTPKDKWLGACVWVGRGGGAGVGAGRAGGDGE